MYCCVLNIYEVAEEKSTHSTKPNRTKKQQQQPRQHRNAIQKSTSKQVAMARNLGDLGNFTKIPCTNYVSAGKAKIKLKRAKIFEQQC